MLKGFEHAWICRKCQSEASVVTGKDYNEMESKLKYKRTNCCNAEYEYIGLRPIIQNIATGPVIKADPNYVPPVEEEEVIEEVIKEEIPEEIKEEKEIEENSEITNNSFNALEEDIQNIKEEDSEVVINDQHNDIEEEPKNTVQIETPATLNVSEVKSTSFDINELVPPGPKGVSNAQMIPAMKNAIKESSKEKLEIIKSHYPDVFQGSIKYIGKKMQDQLKALGF